ncbi:heterokaryon incompatibility protein-domain-containing protein [Cadophora sp. MPI-SDFR-AT-0126]|nr:heterokaryon incompatibility protein-domain-containing protein [Leotiomycetes sp. MPI-SDFR-AT-0126]
MAFLGFSPAAAIFPLLFVGYLAIMSAIEERLCEQCSRITLSKICETEEGSSSKDTENKLVCTFDPTSGCPLCKLMAKSAVINHDNAETEATKRLSVNMWKKSNNPSEISMYVHGRSLPNFEVRIFADRGTAAAQRISGRQIEYPGSEETLATIVDWANDCQANHPKCKLGISGEVISQPCLPTRVLDVASLESSSVDSVKLFVSNGYQAEYVALSHCWGGYIPVKTTPHTLASHLIGIEVETLSKTFQDAIKITRKLGIRYLWIDSLCIIQDEPGQADWRRESGTMGSIYERAFCVIAATAARNGNEGCFVPRRPIDVVRMPADPLSGTDDYFYIASRDPNRYKEVMESPLNSRGWVFQEYRLARRRIHCAQGQVYWECSHHFVAEDCSTRDGNEWPITLSLALSDNPVGNLARFYALWCLYVKFYSTCDLTQKSDKLPAITGIANRVMQHDGRLKFHHGHWRNEAQDMESSLIWYPAKNTAYKRTEFPRAPSWSWASGDGELEFAIGDVGLLWKAEHDHMESEIGHLKLQIQDIVNRPQNGLDPYYVLHVHGVLKKGKCTRERIPSWLGDKSFLFTEWRTYLILSNNNPVGWVLFDYDDDIPKSNWHEIICAPVASTSRDGRLILILAEHNLNAQPPEYRRIGTGNIFKLSWFHGNDKAKRFAIV